MPGLPGKGGLGVTSAPRPDEPRPAPDVRCTIRKHVIEEGLQFCDCGGLMVGKTAAKNATVVTLFWRGQPAPLLQDLRAGGSRAGLPRD